MDCCTSKLDEIIYQYALTQLMLNWKINALILIQIIMLKQRDIYYDNRVRKHETYNIITLFDCVMLPYHIELLITITRGMLIPANIIAISLGV